MTKFELRLQRLERRLRTRTQRVIYFDARTDPIPEPGSKVRGVLAVPHILPLDEWTAWAVDVNQTIATTIINPLGDTP